MQQRDQALQQAAADVVSARTAAASAVEMAQARLTPLYKDMNLEQVRLISNANYKADINSPCSVRQGVKKARVTCS